MHVMSGDCLYMRKLMHAVNFLKFQTIVASQKGTVLTHADSNQTAIQGLPSLLF